jgi:type IV pilus assembly protein PilQ
MKWITSMKPLIALLMCAAICFGPGIRNVTAAPDKEQPATTPAVIQSVHIRGDGEKTELVIAISAPATYTSYKTTAPDRLVVDFSQVIPADSLAGLAISKGPVKGVTVKRYDTDAGVLTRMEIFLEQNIEPLIAPSMEKVGELKISFPGYVAQQVIATTEKKSEKLLSQPLSQPLEQAKQADTPAVPVTEKVEEVKQNAEQVKTVPTQPATVSSLPVITNIVANGGGIEILATAEISDYKNFRLNKPERVVVDIPNAKLGLADKMVVLNTAGVSSARIGSYSDKIRIVFDAINGSLADASIKKTATGLLITFGSKVTKKPDEVSAAAPTAIQQTSSAGQATDKRQVAVTSKESVTAVSSANAQVEAVDFQVLETVTRIMVRVSGSPVVEKPIKASGSISFRIKNVRLPRFLQRSFEARNFVSPVLRITPVLVKTKAGNDVLMRIALKEDAAFELRRETDIIYLDIKHPADMVKPVKQPEAKQTDIKKTEAPKSAASASPVTSVTTSAVKPQDTQLEKVTEKTQVGGKREYTGRKVTLEFADAEVRKIFQLLSEVSTKNFVLGDEVSGNISLKLVNVPWDQALDIILDTKGLDKREDGNIVLIRGKGKFKSIMDEEIEIRKATLKGEPLETTMFDVNYADLPSIVTQFTALKTDRGMITQDQRTNKIIVKDVKTALADMRNILKNLDIPEKQVMIEARIVEASTTFTQSLGVNWGIHYRDGSASVAGINAFDTSFGGLASTSAPTSGVSGSSGATAGISFGTLASNIKLDMRLNAAATAGLIRIVSTPRVATLNHKSAKITQGQQIPYTSSTSDKIETKFVEAALALEVTPHINPNGTIVMKIDAKNDSPGTGSPPPINKKQATTEMMLRDGETTVIGGIFVESDTSGEEGVPMMKDIPWLGNLFKSNETKRNKNELLIFITPRIITGSN